MNDSNNDANVLRNIKTPKVFYVVLAIILFLIVCLVLMYFQVNIFLFYNNYHFMCLFIAEYKRFKKFIFTNK